MTAVSTHVVLGGNGVVGRETVRALRRLGEDTVSVGRQRSAVTGARSVIANLLDPAEAGRALSGAKVAYFTVGLAYSARVWAEQWPVILGNTINAAIATATHLVYFDNVYAYGPVTGPMTEQTPVTPTSKKGRVRADALAALHEGASRGLSFTVGRSADFYGPGAATSVFNMFVLDKVAAGKPGTWLYDADQPHSLTFTPDVGDALAILGTDPVARGRVWHLPTAPALTGREYVALASGPDARCATMSRTTMRMGALFARAARETLEMDYQFTRPYVFDSSAFESTFGVQPTSVADGIARTLAR
ncbi:MAG: NAD-dependent epimerase/dehydratase [Microbacteriaceae bacterium]|nr:NAD-dependent epimerase/dehydratase [Microbacteriaceae bacterium]